MKKWIGLIVALLLRWYLRRFGYHGNSQFGDPYGCSRVNTSHFWHQHLKWSFARLTEYNASATPPRPTSGDPLAIRWSLWVRLGRDWYWGYGAVRTFARQDDIDIWIAGRGPWSSASDEIEFKPPIKISAADIPIKVRNTAVNDRDAAGVITLRGIFAGDDIRFQRFTFGPLAAGRSDHQINCRSGSLGVEIDGVQIRMLPTGPERIERIYGFPEWFREDSSEI